MTGNLAAEHVTLTGGSAGGGYGGAIFVLGTLALDRSTVRANSAPAGGGLYLAGPTTIRNSTLDANSAPDGAAVLSASSDPVAIIATTVSASKRSAAVHDVSGTVTLTAALLAANAAGDCATAVGDGSYNVAAGASCHFTAATSQNSAPALTANLATLRDRGGKVFTRGLLPASPAVDRIPLGATDSDGVALCGSGATDARDVVRPQGPKCAAGSFEPLALTTLQVVNNESFDAYPARQPHDVTAVAAGPAGFPAPTGTATLVDPFHAGVTYRSGAVNAPLALRLGAGFFDVSATYAGDANYRSSGVRGGPVHLMPYGSISVPCDVGTLANAAFATYALASAVTDDGQQHNDIVRLAAGCTYDLGDIRLRFGAVELDGNGATIYKSSLSALAEPVILGSPFAPVRNASIYDVVFAELPGVDALEGRVRSGRQVGQRTDPPNGVRGLGRRRLAPGDERTARGGGRHRQHLRRQCAGRRGGRHARAVRRQHLRGERRFLRRGHPTSRSRSPCWPTPAAGPGSRMVGATSC